MKQKRYLATLPLISLLFLSMEYPTKNTEDVLTAGDVISRIQAHITSSWQPETVDTYKAGGPAVKVTGIATTFMATMEVLKAAKAKGLNMVIAHEPTFYDHMDNTERYGNDSVVAAKQKFLKDNGMVVFRFHDHWHSTQPDGIYKGVVAKMGWEAYKQNERPYTYQIPKTTLREIVGDLKKKLNANTIRVVGDPEMKITKAALSLGAAGSDSQISVLQREDVQLLIIGETREWETVPYVSDAVTLGLGKALIVLGHEPSEEPGMDYCAEWLKTFINEVPVEFVPAKSPFWVPE